MGPLSSRFWGSVDDEMDEAVRSEFNELESLTNVRTLNRGISKIVLQEFYDDRPEFMSTYRRNQVK